MTTTKGAQINDLLAKRTELYNELANCPPIKLGTEWFNDRAREMEWVNKQLARLGALPGCVTAV